MDGNSLEIWDPLERLADRQLHFRNALQLDFDRFHDFMERMKFAPALISVALSALSGPNAMIDAFEAANRRGVSSDAFKANYDLARQAQSRARGERDAGPDLHLYQAIVFVWSMYEHYVKRTASVYTRYFPDKAGVKRSQIMSIIRDPGELPEYEAESFVSKKWKEQSGSIQDRVFGLYSSIGVEVERHGQNNNQLQELYALRNLVVHNMGHIDQSFMVWCENNESLITLYSKPGDPVRISAVELSVYAESAKLVSTCIVASLVRMTS